MKKNPTTSKKLLAVIILLIILIGLVIFGWNKWAAPAYEAHKLKNTLSSQLKELGQPLSAMGFDYSKISAKCTHKGANHDCAADTSSYVVYKDKNKLNSLNASAANLSDLLNKNGWHQRPDFPTVAWFKKLSQGIDYQPDQLNFKQVGDAYCVVDFFTSFSHPSPPAITLSSYCTKGQSPFALD